MEQILVPRSEAQKVKDTNFNIWFELSKLAKAPQKSADPTGNSNHKNGFLTSTDSVSIQCQE